MNTNDMMRKITFEGLEGMGRFYSIYRAMVLKNDDPRSMNRLKVFIPGIHGGLRLWALPRNQHGSNQTGFKYLAPEIGDVVYVSFEMGDPSKPLWEYHSWATGQMPDSLDAPSVCGFVTPNGISVLFDDSDGTLDLYLFGEANIYSEDVIKIAGAKGVIVNGGNNGGVIKIKELTEKLNNLVNEVDALRKLLNTHTHPGVTAGSSTCLPITNQSTSPLTQFNKDDYENLNFKH